MGFKYYIASSNYTIAMLLKCFIYNLYAQKLPISYIIIITVYCYYYQKFFEKSDDTYLAVLTY